MEKEPRKASEVLLELEAKIDTILGLIKSQDLNNKIISNKLNTVSEKLEKLEKQPSTSKITVEAVNTLPNQFNQAPQPEAGKQIPVSADFNLAVDEAPNGFRRTSRPETYSGDNSYLPPQPKVQTPKFPVQLPKNLPVKAEVVVPPAAINRTQGQTFPPPSMKETTTTANNVVQNAIPIMQRVVDANGKSIFLADVEIIDLSTMQSVFKNRTNGTGKWMASLPVGAYRVFIRKRDSLTKEKLETAQDINIDGSTSTVELPLMIIKK